MVKRVLAKQDMSPEEARVFREFTRRWELETTPLADDIADMIASGELHLESADALQAQLRGTIGGYQGDFEVAITDVGEDGIQAGRALAERRFALDISLETVPEWAIEELDEWAVTVSEGVSNTMAEEMRNYLRGAYEDGLSIDEIAEEFGSEFVSNRLHGTHEEQIARDIVQGTSNQGNHSAFEDADVFAEEWNTAIDGRERDDHAAADGQVVALETAFMVGGEELRFPHDPQGSIANTTNCRCNLLPRWRDEFTADEISTLENGGRLGA